MLTLDGFPKDRGIDAGDRADSVQGDGSEVLIELDRVEVYQATGMLTRSWTSARLRPCCGCGRRPSRLGGPSEVASAILDRRLELDRDPDGQRRSRP